MRVLLVVIKMGFLDKIVGHWRCGGSSYLTFLFVVLLLMARMWLRRGSRARKGKGGGEGGKGGRRDAETEEEIGGAREEAGKERNDIEADAAEAV